MSVKTKFCRRWSSRTVAEAAKRALAEKFPSYSSAELPINLELVARSLGIVQILDTDMSGTDGLLFSETSGAYIVKLRRGQSPARRRFSLAHEIGHVMVYESLGDSKLKAATAAGGVRIDRGRTQINREEEALCDLIAAELLMPSTLLIHEVRRSGLTAERLPALAQRFRVSIQAMARRVVEILPENLAISLWRMRESDNLIIPDWNVAKRGYIEIETALRADEPDSRCFAEKPTRGWYWLTLSGPTDEYFVDVAPIGGPKRKWLMLSVMSSAPEHILAKLSRAEETEELQERLF